MSLNDAVDVGQSLVKCLTLGGHGYLACDDKKAQSDLWQNALDAASS